MRGIAVIAALAAWPAWPAWAEGFRTRDLTRLDTAAFAADEYDRSREPDRLTIMRFGAEVFEEGFVAVDLQLGRSRDGTEGRMRSGATTTERLAALCEADAEAGASACLDLRAAPLGGAVGWATRTQAMGLELTTHVLIQDGDMSTIRAMGDDRAAVDALAARAFETLAPQIVAP